MFGKNKFTLEEFEIININNRITQLDDVITRCEVEINNLQQNNHPKKKVYSLKISDFSSEANLLRKKLNKLLKGKINVDVQQELEDVDSIIEDIKNGLDDLIPAI